MNILNIISNLGRGGAESTLLKILLNDQSNKHIVISLKKDGELAEIIKNNNIQLYELNFKFYNIFIYYKIGKIILKNRPDIIQTWMYHADFIGLIYRFIFNIKCLWCVRTGTLKFSLNNIIAIIIRKICAIISNFSHDKIIYCSYNSKVLHEKIGYNKNSSIVIPNGYDTNYFNEQLIIKNKLRNNYKLEDDAVILGLVGRLHEQKNHIFFLEIILRIKKNYKQHNIIGVIVTPRITQNNLKQKLDKFISYNNLEKNIIFIDGSKNLNEKINIIDINLLCSSWGEAFPNVICETMLTGIPNIAFDIGDVDYIIKNKKYIVKELNVNSFVEKIIYLLDIKKNKVKDWEEIKNQQRESITSYYTLDKMVSSYKKVWKEANINNKERKTIYNFGEEWKTFHQKELLVDQNKAIFDKYFNILPSNKLNSNSVILDAGCGSGRWSYFLAPKVKKLFCLEPSLAINVAKENLQNFNNISFINDTIQNLKLEDNSFDFIACLGVLHHTTDVENNLKILVNKLKKQSPILLYIYYNFENRNIFFKIIWQLSNLIRLVISRMPYKIKLLLTNFIAYTVYYPLSRFSKLLNYIGIVSDFLPLSWYKDKDISILKNDSMDRFGTIIEKRYSRHDISNLMKKNGLEKIKFSNSEPFWCVLGYKK